MAAADNLYQELKNELQQIKDFLTPDVVKTISTAIKALETLIPQVKDLINQLITLMGQIRTAIQNLNVKAIPGLDKVSAFTTLVTTVLQTMENLLPDQKSAIDEVLSAAKVVGGLPSLDAIKTEILNLIDAIVADLKSLGA